MAKYFIERIDNIRFKLRVALKEHIAQFHFIFFDGQYKILTYAFLPLEALEKQSDTFKEVTKDKALPIIELGKSYYQEMIEDTLFS